MSGFSPSPLRRRRAGEGVFRGQLDPKLVFMISTTPVNPGWIGYLLILGIGIFWGFNWPAVKIALGELPPFTLRSMGLSSGGLLLLTLARLRGASLAVPVAERLPLAIAGLLSVAGFNLFAAFGQLHMATSRAAIVAFTMPVWASLLAVLFLGERLDRRRLLSLALGMAGLAALLGPQALSLLDNPIGPLCMLAGALSWASGTVYIKSRHWSLATLPFAGWQVLIASLPAWLGALVFDPWPDLTTLSTPVVVAMAYHILLPMAFCHFAWFGIVARFPAGVAAIGTLLIPVVGVLGSVWLLGERPGWPEGLALVLVLSAVAIVLLKPRTA